MGPSYMFHGERNVHKGPIQALVCGVCGSAGSAGVRGSGVRGLWLAGIGSGAGFASLSLRETAIAASTGNTGIRATLAWGL